MALEAQVRVHNVMVTSGGKAVQKVLSIKASELYKYVDNLRKECNGKFTPNRHKKFEKYPLLSVIDSFDTGEEFIFNLKKDLPNETVLNSKGNPVLIIIPEEDIMGKSINRFDLVNKKANNK